MRGALPGPGKPLRRCDLQTDQAARRGLDVMGLIAYLGRRAHVWRWRVRYWWLDTPGGAQAQRSEEHTSELQSRRDLVCRLLLEKKKKKKKKTDKKKKKRITREE